MKLGIDKEILEVTKDLIVSEIDTYRKLYSKASDFDSRTIIRSSIKNLKQAYSNLDKHAKVIKFIGSK